MGKINEIQEQVTQSFGNNSFTTKITDTTVEFDSARDSFTFKDEVNVPVIKVDGVQSAPFTAEEKAKLATVTTPMQIKGRVDSVSDLPTEDVKVGDTYLVGLSGSETFDEYVCTGFAGTPEAPVWESVGSTQVQADWDQTNTTSPDYIKNKPTIPSAQVQADWDQNDNTKVDYIKNRICSSSTYDKLFDDEVVVEQSGSGSNVFIDIHPMSVLPANNSENIFYPVTLNGTTYLVRMIPQPNATTGTTYMSEQQWVAGGLFYDSSGNLYGTGKNAMFGAAPGTYSLTIYDTLQYIPGSLTDFDFTHNQKLEVGKKYNIFVSETGAINNVSKYTTTAVQDSGSVSILFNGVTISYIEGGAHTGKMTGVTGQAANWGLFVITPYIEEIETIDDKFIPDTVVRTSQLGGVQFKIAGSPASLQASIDGGSTWQTVTLS